jgi:UDP-glucose 4-epimerase
VQRTNEILDIVGDFSKAVNILNWKPKHNLIHDILNNEIE